MQETKSVLHCDVESQRQLKSLRVKQPHLVDDLNHYITGKRPGRSDRTFPLQELNDMQSGASHNLNFEEPLQVLL